MSQNQMSENQNGKLYEKVNAVVCNYLEHHGVKDQTWGVTHGPPYPLNRNKAKQAKLKAKAKARQAREKEKTKKRIAKAQVKAENKARKEAKTAERKAEKLEKNKQKYSKTAESLYKHRDMYSYDEIASALQKFEWENKIKDYMERDMTRAKNQAQSMASTTKSVVDFATSVIDGYNVAVGAGNSLFDLDLKPIRIPQSKKEDKKDK